MTQWSISVLVYLASALVLWSGVWQGWVEVSRLLAWCAYLLLCLATVYVALRTGWSERFPDPALTAAQTVGGVISVAWAYVICGPMRSVALFPLMLIFAFGAFSLTWRQIGWLTGFALGSLVATVAVLHSSRASVEGWSLADPELRLDVTNLLMMIILLPALSVVAARLSALRSKLSLQRTMLTGLLAKVQQLATRDELTGLSNRRHMLERLAQEQTRFERQGYPFSVANIDIDHFKRINDAHGHAAGDAVLQAFAAEASAMLRSGDLLARWGGEEFLLMLPNTRGVQAQAILQRLLERVRALPQVSARPLTFSAGVAEHRTGETVLETVARADQKMYQAKQLGRNKVELE